MEVKNKERDLIMCVMLSLFTLGIYTIYWFYCMTEEANDLSEEETGCAGGTLAIMYAILTFGVYLWYWSYKMGDRIYIAREKRCMPVETSMGPVYLVLSIIQLDFVGFLMIQHQLNKIARASQRPDEVDVLNFV